MAWDAASEASKGGNQTSDLLRIHRASKISGHEDSISKTKRHKTIEKQDAAGRYSIAWQTNRRIQAEARRKAGAGYLTPQERGMTVSAAALFGTHNGRGQGQAGIANWLGKPREGCAVIERSRDFTLISTPLTTGD